MRTINDVVYGTPPTSRWGRRITFAQRWFQLDANRWVVTGLLLGLTFVSILAVGLFGPVSVQSFLTEGISPGAVLVELLKTIVSVVVIVLSINQLVLSPGLGPVGNQQDRYEGTMELREQVEAHTGLDVSPSSPTEFLEALMEALADQAKTLEASTRHDPTRHADVKPYTESLIAEATSVADLLSESRFGRFESTSHAVRFSISGKVRTLREIRTDHAETLSTEEREAFDELETLLERFTVAREYLKTVYIRSEYIGLSEALLYVGLPSIVVTYCAAQLYEPSIFPGQWLGVDAQLLFVSGAVTVALAPLVVLIAYVFRLAALSRSTLFVGPFSAKQPTERQSDD